MDGNSFIFYSIVDFVLNYVVMLMQFEVEQPMFYGLLRDDKFADFD